MSEMGCVLARASSPLRLPGVGWVWASWPCRKARTGQGRPCWLPVLGRAVHGQWCVEGQVWVFQNFCPQEPSKWFLRPHHRTKKGSLAQGLQRWGGATATVGAPQALKGRLDFLCGFLEKGLALSSKGT